MDKNYDYSVKWDHEHRNEWEGPVVNVGIGQRLFPKEDSK